jgi:hypothetical protein
MHSKDYDLISRVSYIYDIDYDMPRSSGDILTYPKFSGTISLTMLKVGQNSLAWHSPNEP